MNKLDIIECLLKNERKLSELKKIKRAINSPYYKNGQVTITMHTDDFNIGDIHVKYEIEIGTFEVYLNNEISNIEKENKDLIIKLNNI